MKRNDFLRLAVAAGLAAGAALGQTPAARPAPKLVLVITVDQFRYDYLTRFRTEYRGGLHRLLTQGAVFTNGFYEHAPTITAVGHSTILSGASPAMSGIPGNEWYDRATKANVTSVSDPSQQTLGAPERIAASPHRLLVSTVGDEIKMSGKGESKVVGISVKDRSAILPGGRMADAAYWFDNETGRFVSSTWYMPALPAWVESYNGKKPGERYLGKEWRAAGGALLRTMPGQPDTMFYSNLETSPFGNELIEEFAERAIVEEKLGAHSGVDLLSVSFSCNDYVGHALGPDSPEAHDISLRTDQTIGRLFTFLERQVGMRNVVVAFTADHGVSPVPEVNGKRRMPGGRLIEKDLRATIENALSARFGPGKWIESRSTEMPYLNQALIAEKKLDIEMVRETAAAAIRNFPHIFRVYTKGQLIRQVPPVDMVARRVQNGYFPPRGPDLVIVPEPYWMFSAKGTTHGTPFNYDAHVPIILMGSGIKGGRYHRAAAVNDIAPTLATLLDVETPSGSMGRVLDECLTY